jgi:hypothetical protein
MCSHLPCSTPSSSAAAPTLTLHRTSPGHSPPPGHSSPPLRSSPSFCSSPLGCSSPPFTATAPPAPPQCSCCRVVLHIDVDCFYCQVEVMDDPALVGKPLAVTQFNAGGFVAVSYEARAAGVRCGDGVGAGGRAAIARLQDMGAVSAEEAARR